MKLITDIGNWLVQSGALVTLAVFAWKYLKPVMLKSKARQDRAGKGTAGVGQLFGR